MGFEGESRSVLYAIGSHTTVIMVTFCFEMSFSEKARFYLNVNYLRKSARFFYGYLLF